MSHLVDKGKGFNAGVFRKNPKRTQVEGDTYPVWLDLVAPQTELPDETRIHALYYFLVLAHRDLARVEKDVNYEVDGFTEQSELARRGLSKKFRKLAESTSRLYDVSLDDMFAGPLVHSMLQVLSRRQQIVRWRVSDWILAGGRDALDPIQGDYWFNEDHDGS